MHTRSDVPLGLLESKPTVVKYGKSSVLSFQIRRVINDNWSHSPATPSHREHSGVASTILEPVWTRGIRASPISNNGNGLGLVKGKYPVVLE